MRNTHVVLLVLGVIVVSVVGTIAYTGSNNTEANTQSPNYSNLAKLLLTRNLVRFTSYNGENLSVILQTPSIGLVTAMPMEQAPILAAMSVYAVVNISGYEFFVGSIGGQQVVSVRSGEK